MPAVAIEAHPDGYLLHSEDHLANLAQEAIDYAASLGVEEASAIVREGAGLTIRASDGHIADARRDGSQSLSITVYDAQRTGRAATQALDRAAIRRTVEQAVAIARQVEPDDQAGLAAPDWIVRSPQPLKLFSPSRATVDDLADAALEINAAAMALATSDPVRVVDAGASSHDMRWARALSREFCHAGSASTHSRWCQAIAERDGTMAKDHAVSADRQVAGLPSSSEIGDEAARRAVAGLGRRSISTQRVAVLLDARIATSLIATLVGALDGMAQHHGRTFLPKPIGERVMASHLSLTEDPFEPFGLASAAFDSDGIAAASRNVVENGIVRGLFLSALSARKLGMRPTGNADGPTNLTLRSACTAPGDDLRALCRRMGRGLLLTEFLGGDVDPVTGAFSKAATGFWIEDGEPSYPVHDFTVASDLRTMLGGVVALGDDVYRSGAFRSGSILIDEMQVAGR